MPICNLIFSTSRNLASAIYRPRPTRSGGSRGSPHPLNLSWYWKPMQSVRDRDRSPPPPLGMWMTSHGQCPRGGACECPRVGVFYNFLEGGWRHADNVQGGGVLQEILYPRLTRLQTTAVGYACTVPQARIQDSEGGGGRTFRRGGGGGFVHYRNFRSGSKLVQGPSWPGQIKKQKKEIAAMGGGVRSPKRPPCIRGGGGGSFGQALAVYRHLLALGLPFLSVEEKM